MTISIAATFENGAFKPEQPVILPEGTKVQLQVNPVDPDFDPLEAVIGIGESGRTDASENHDKYIYGKRPSEADVSVDQRDPLEEVIGICDDGPETSLAERHDEFIYGFKLDTERRS